MREDIILKNRAKFFDSCIRIHDNKYNYSKSEYKGTAHKIVIICPIHGEFLQKAATHYSGHGCSKCARLLYGNGKRSNTKEFIEKAKTIHENTYIYDKVNYVNSDINVIIICKEHGEFEQAPRTHLSNKGCPKCNLYVGYSRSQWINYNKDNEGIFYIIKCWNENEEFYKIGITGRTIKERYNYIRTMPYNYEIIKEEKSTDLDYIWNLEKEYKRKLKDLRYKPLIKFAGGSVECFTKI